MELINYLQEFNTASIIFRLLLATVLGGLLGMERTQKHEAAGIRTFSLVCLGAALIIMTNEFIYLKFGTGDLSRMPAQVISGIGFLGGGTIIMTSNNRIKGLTTASCLWISAILGLCIGSGFLVISIIGFLILMLTLRLLTEYNEKVLKNSPNLTLYLEVDSTDGIDVLRSYAKENFFQIKSIHRKREKPLKRNDLCISVELDLTTKRSHEEILCEIHDLGTVHYAEEI